MGNLEGLRTFVLKCFFKLVMQLGKKTTWEITVLVFEKRSIVHHAGSEANLSFQLPVIKDAILMRVRSSKRTQFNTTAAR